MNGCWTLLNIVYYVLYVRHQTGLVEMVWLVVLVGLLQSMETFHCLNKLGSVLSTEPFPIGFISSLSLSFH